MNSKRVIVLVMDSVGVGALPDAAEYGDEGSNTFLHVARECNPLNIPNLTDLGIGNILELPGVPASALPKGAFGKMGEVSQGKDTTTGHWELMGLVLDKPFPTYPSGFPPELILEYEKRIGRRVIGNIVASGTEIIASLGAEHIRTGFPIVYTSADSVFQVAAHEEVIPLPELYRFCGIAREMLTGEHGVGRVIARPFVGSAPTFTRTKGRKDFSLEPSGRTVMDLLKEQGLEVQGIGKIEDIFAHRGLTSSNHTPDNKSSLEATAEALGAVKHGLIFTNCVDFDMVYGHRNDVRGYGRALEELDSYIFQIMSKMGPEDILMITADHGCDPVTPSTDHSREYVPILVWGSEVKPGTDLGVRRTFADLGATVAELLGAEWAGPGTSFAGSVLKR